MERKWCLLPWGVFGLVIWALVGSCSATLSPSGVNYEVLALFAIKAALHDPYNAMENWDITSVDPCSWRMITCTPDGYVSALLLQNNAISGHIPAEIGKLEHLQTLDLSNNNFDGEIPSSLGELSNLNYLRLNNNSLSGQIPESLSKLNGLTLVDVSFNNLSGRPPKLQTRTFKVIGNSLICGQNSKNNCSAFYPEPMPFPPDGGRGQEAGTKAHSAAIAFGASFGSLFVIVVVLSYLWCRYRRNQQIFFDLNDMYDPEGVAISTPIMAKSTSFISLCVGVVTKWVRKFSSASR
ncbi:hypothetical protein DM860_006962 [Cuscuta australis]|uniref:Uncharacterized protein n=1 Tax=Cuscuta australis TaxID=267555 RepID=A0A328E6V0_9ASTE|nr:hypothetical protein DM860_006962 [Cuscuta australis]